MRVIGKPVMLTHNDPSPNVIAPPTAGAPSSMLFVTLLVFGSMRSTLPSLPHSTHTEPSPNASAVGPGDTSIDLSTKFVCGSTRRTRSSEGHVSHSAVSPNANVLQSG